ncbi:hypothetical protein TNCV_2207061 [Trichonephila clavipes]|uniref:Uncharacterized protein n=1 Tax=Trichonephila clavipes TaxID=2585209 RepID=A0A8X6S5Z7_TRICX|nr:hypothetical protein TNCV_2207061 [Trichonephila clavipes]
MSLRPTGKQNSSWLRMDVHSSESQCACANKRIHLRIYTRAFGDGSHHCESCQETRKTPELAPSSPNYHTTPPGGRLSSRQI